MLCLECVFYHGGACPYLDEVMDDLEEIAGAIQDDFTLLLLCVSFKNKPDLPEQQKPLIRTKSQDY